MRDIRETKAFQERNTKLMEMLEARDPKALGEINALRAMGARAKNDAVVGYAYYRYAYYYYFTRRDIRLFRKNLRLAIRYLLRSRDMEYLGGAYTLVAYDAQDMGCYDVAYAYFMIAVQAAEQKEGIALPGLIEASAGRLLIELGEYKKGRQQQKKAARRLSLFPSMHTFHYNVILTYADIALASFLLQDARETEAARKKIEAHYEAADKEEKELSTTYYCLGGIYHALLTGDDDLLEQRWKGLLRHWKTLPLSDLCDYLFEVEGLCDYMLAHDYIDQAGQLLTALAGITREENLTALLRYRTLQVAYYEKLHHLTMLKKSLRLQHEVQRRKDAETAGTVRYAMEFSDIIEEIAEMRKHAEEENLALHRQADTDALTGLPNRNAMTNYLQQKLEEAEREKTSFGIGIVDVDRFKEFNDTYGHQAGDACLRRIGQLLLRFNDDPRIFCARYGGDEFVVGYFGLTGAAIQEIDEKMKAGVQNLKDRLPDGPLCISQGICNRVPNGRMKLWDYLSLADKRLYEKKKQL